MKKSNKPENERLLKVLECLETEKRAMRFSKWSNAEIEILINTYFLLRNLIST